jgi:hypothetical protein
VVKFFFIFYCFFLFCYVFRRGSLLYVPHIPDSQKGVLSEVLTHIPKNNYASEPSLRLHKKHFSNKNELKTSLVKTTPNSQAQSFSNMSLEERRN